MATWRGIRVGWLAIVIIAAGPLSACNEKSSGQPPQTTTTGTTTASPTSSVSTPRPTTSPSSEQSCGAPALRVLAPADGSRVRVPFPVDYEVRCFTVGRDGTIFVAADGMRIDLHPQSSSGTVTVPDHPLLSGRRTVTFQLVAPDGQALSNSEATVTRQLTIEGRR